MIYDEGRPYNCCTISSVQQTADLGLCLRSVYTGSDVLWHGRVTVNYVLIREALLQTRRLHI